MQVIRNAKHTLLAVFAQRFDPTIRGEGRDARFRSSISAVAPTDSTFHKSMRKLSLLLRICLAALVLSTQAFPTRGAEIGPIGPNQRTLVICVRYTNALTTRMASCSNWVTLLTNETNQYFNRATFNQTNFQFETISGTGAPANGWLDLPYDNTGYGFYRTGQDAITLADPFANFALYNRVLVITSWPDFGGQGGGPWWWAVNEGAEATVTPAAGGGPVPSRLMTLSNTNEWLAHSYGSAFDEGAATMDHELGHQLGAPTHYGTLNFAPDASRDTITPWDIMGLSPTLNHFLGYPKTDRGWVPSGPRIVTVGPPTTTALDQTTLLRPQEQTTASPQIIRIPFTSSGPFVGYVVENRRRINGDEELPEAGILVTAVDESPNTLVHAYVMDDPSAPLDLSHSPLEIGDSFTDAGRNLTVTAVSQSGDNTNVRVQYAAPPTTFDPAITPWGAPPWETPDIWIDSPKNMYGTYLYTDGSGSPIGNGDDAWVNHDNRVHVRVHNYGVGPATNVRAQVFVNSPPGMGDAGPDWAFIGTIVYSTIAGGGQADGFVIWKPTVGAHTCIKVVLVDTPGELVTTNNLAQENVSHFDTSSGSPYQPVHFTANVNNPFDQELPVHMNVKDVPYGWAVVLDPPEMSIPPRGKHPVDVAVYPSGFPPHEADDAPSATVEAGRTGRCGDCPPHAKWDPSLLKETSRLGFIGKPKVEAQMPYHDTFVPIGGIDIWTHLARPTRLTCHVGGVRSVQPTLTIAPGDAIAPAGNAGLLPKPGTKPGETPGYLPKMDPTRLQELGAIVRRPEPEPRVVPGRFSIEGQLTPATAGAVIAIELTQNGKRRLEFVRTDDNGHYSFRADKFLGRGRTVAQAFYSGGGESGEAESGFCPFVPRVSENRVQ
jgi:M6 family metalloprotease-like protein